MTCGSCGYGGGRGLGRPGRRPLYRQLSPSL
ncbi:hypothetical protein SFR_1868 [Streptomyces sp. FR-008]|nr:hypothetical protein SFR_1868 [Streptomyces sp. FR-008]